MGTESGAGTEGSGLGGCEKISASIAVGFVDDSIS
jgi:hypothetical protein